MMMEGYYCPECHEDLHTVECGQCVDGYTHHECGDDTCFCLYPQDNVECDLCDGHGFWWQCLNKCGNWTSKELEELIKEE